MANQVEVSELRAQLAAEDPSTRASAAEAVRALGGGAVPLLEALLAAAVDSSVPGPLPERSYAAPAAAAAALSALGPLVAPALPKLRATVETLKQTISFLQGHDDEEWFKVREVLSPLESLLRQLEPPAPREEPWACPWERSWVPT